MKSCGRCKQIFSTADLTDHPRHRPICKDCLGYYQQKDAFVKSLLAKQNQSFVDQHNAKSARLSAILAKLTEEEANWIGPAAVKGGLLCSDD